MEAESPTGDGSRTAVLGAGFIGSAVERLVHRHGGAIQVYTRNPAPGSGHRELDWGTFSCLDGRLADIDTVVHAVSTTVPFTAELDPVSHLEQNVVASARLLELLARAGVRIVFLSTAGAMFSVAGRHDELSLPAPLGMYGIGKRHVEELLEWFGRNHGLRWTVLRPTNVYGPSVPARPQGVIGHLMRAAATGRPFELWGDGRGRKDYLHVDDMAEAILATLALPVDHTTFHVASGERASVVDLIAQVEAASGRSLVVEKRRSGRFDIPDVDIDCSMFRTTAGWSPTVSLVDGIESTWKRWLQDCVPPGRLA